jgi:hypothetical protein
MDIKRYPIEEYPWKQFWILMYVIVGGTILSVIVLAELILGG